MRNSNNFRMALSSIMSTKWRSFLTTLGVVIGVASVVTIVSLGEGVKHQVISQINRNGKDLLTVRGGHIANINDQDNVKKINLFNLFSGGTLSDADYQELNKTKGAELVVPFATISGMATSQDGVKDSNIDIVATNEKAAVAMNQEVAYGSFFDSSENKMPVAVIGKRVAEDLFKENVPIGKTFDLRGQTFTVRGVFRPFEANPLTPEIDYNKSIFIPYEYSKQIVNNPLHLYQILIRPKSGITPDSLSREVSETLERAHGGQNDFSVLQAKDNIAVASSFLNIITTLVTAVAGISLFVGGVGIMNIMLVAVSERTYEIGIRKSIGATNRQILNQFLIEAVVLSGTGGALGIITSLIINYFLRVFTSLQPVITPMIMLVAFITAIIVGVFFGITPALKAARKDPIEALRRT